MPGKKLVASQKNWWKGKKDVIASMDKKLAGGRNEEMEKEYRKLLWRKKMSNTTIVAGIILIAAATLAAFNWKSIKKTLHIEQSFFASPVRSLAQDYKKGAITADQYALYLCDLLVNYKRLPQEYKSGIPQFTRGDVFARLSRIWPRVTLSSRDEIQQLLPMFIPQSDSEKADTGGAR